MTLVVCVKLPDVPVMVTETDPTVAVVAAVNVSVLVPVAGFVPNAAVVPEPMPVAERVTAPVNPPEGVIVMVVAPCDPRATLTLAGEALSEKSGDVVAFTVRLTVAVCVKLPDVPVIVTVEVPVAAVLLAVSVSVLVVVAGLGLNAAVTPVGKPDADKVTLLVNPFKRVTVTVLVPPAPPFVTVTLAGEALSEKSGDAVAFTVRFTVAVCVRLPDVPVMVTVEVPVAAVLLAVSVSVLVVVAGLGLNAAVTPVGKPDADKVTLLVNPFKRVTVTVLVPPAPPFVTVRLDGDAPSEKLAAAVVVTVTLKLVLCVRVPDVPVIVTVLVLATAKVLALSVSVLEAVAGFGLKVALTPLGKPEAAKLTLPVKPF